VARAQKKLGEFAIRLGVRCTSSQHSLPSLSLPDEAADSRYVTTSEAGVTRQRPARKRYLPPHASTESSAKRTTGNSMRFISRLSTSKNTSTGEQFRERKNNGRAESHGHKLQKAERNTLESR
jgi:hypothetical protein